MTEAEWMAGAKPTPMLESLRGKASDRKLRLFAVACCRRIWGLLPHQANRDLVAAVEERPDGTRDDPELWAATVASSAVRREVILQAVDAYLAVKSLGRGFYKDSPLGASYWVACYARSAVATEGRDSEAEGALQAALLRDIIGNPFRPILLKPAWVAWNAGAVRKWAQAIYDGRRFADLPILADALEDAGCADAALLGHCRGGGEHVRGCWVIDLLLGKE
jgi:hypothetical protein